VELENGTEIHAIGLVKLRPFKRGEDVAVEAAYRHCRLLAL
jgi:hypothetical protein